MQIYSGFPRGVFSNECFKDSKRSHFGDALGHRAKVFPCAGVVLFPLLHIILSGFTIFQTLLLLISVGQWITSRFPLGCRRVGTFHGMECKPTKHIFIFQYMPSPKLGKTENPHRCLVFLCFLSHGCRPLLRTTPGKFQSFKGELPCDMMLKKERRLRAISGDFRWRVNSKTNKEPIRSQ